MFNYSTLKTLKIGDKIQTARGNWYTVARIEGTRIFTYATLNVYVHAASIIAIKRS